MARSLTIPGVETVHVRETWEPDGFRLTESFTKTPGRRTNWSVADTTAAHYTSAINLPDGDPGEILNGVDGIRALLARTQIDYYTNRTGGGYTRKSDGRFFPGYAIGYNFAVDWLGGVWELRGWDFSPAATSKHNGHTLAVLLLTDRADPGSPLMLRSARMIQRECVRRGGRLANRPWPHGSFRTRTGTGTATACCGPALTAQIDAGLLDLDYQESEPPQEEPMPKLYNIEGDKITLYMEPAPKLLVRVTPTQWTALGNPPATGTLSKAQARSYAILPSLEHSMIGLG